MEEGVKVGFGGGYAFFVVIERVGDEMCGMFVT
jgi:hypothetical protein